MSTVPYSPAHDVRKYISLEMALSLVGVAFWLLLAMPDLSKDVTGFSEPPSMAKASQMSTPDADLYVPVRQYH